MDDNKIAGELAERTVSMARERDASGDFKGLTNEVVEDARRGIAIRLAEARAPRNE
jgi:hypothetical protein